MAKTVQIKMPNGKEYVPMPTQRAAHKDPRRYVLYAGGYGCVRHNTKIVIKSMNNSIPITIEKAYNLQEEGRLNSNLIRSYNGNQVLFYPFEKIIQSGVKPVFRLTLENGKNIDLTEDHKVMTKNGYIECGKLTCNNEVLCDLPKTKNIKKKNGKTYKTKKFYTGLKFHPYSKSYSSQWIWHRVHQHRIAYEAKINNLELEEYIEILKSNELMSEKLKYIDPKIYDVHHIDGDHYNNNPENLIHLPKKEHSRLHMLKNLKNAEYSKVKSVKYLGLEMTYDVAVVNETSNFVGNEIVIHNCGKSIWGIVNGILLSAAYPKNLGIVCRNTIPALKSTTMRTFLDLIPKELIQGFNKQDRLLKLINGSEVIFTSSDDYKKFESSEIGWFMIDEADQVKEHAFNILSNRLRCPYVPHDKYKGMVVCNPTSKNHWIYKRFTQDDSIYAMHLAPTAENKDHLPKGYIEDLTKRFSPEMAKRFLMGEFTFTPTGVAVFQPDYIPQLHIADLKYNPHRTLIRGWDFGFHHPSVVFCQLDDDNRLLVLEEFLGKDVPLPVFCDQVEAKQRMLFPEITEYEDYCDPAGNQVSDKGDGESSVKILREAIGARPKFRRTKIMDGIEIMRKRLRTMSAGKPKMLLSANCELLIEAFAGGYHMDEKTGDKPEKDGYYDHLVDALRYICVNITGINQEDIIELMDYKYIPNNSTTGY